MPKTPHPNSYWRYINDLILPDSKDSQFPSSQKKLWSYIKSLRRDHTAITSLQSDYNPITNSLDKAKPLNQQFKSVFTNEPTSNLPDKGLILIQLCQRSVSRAKA